MAIVQVIKELAWEQTFSDNPSAFLQLVRGVVKEASDNAELTGYQLYDIGFQREQEKLMVKLYYYEDRPQSNSA